MTAGMGDGAVIAAATLRVAAPLVLAALGGLIGERAGVVDIGLEGKMLAGAFAAASVAALTGSAWLGLLAAVGVAAVLSLVHGFACITQGGNQVVSGMALNITVSGLTLVFGNAWFQRGGQTPELDGSARFGDIRLPFAGQVAGWPVIGPIYAGVASGNNLLLYAALAAVPGTWWLLYRTRFGLRLRAAGENPAAVEAAGIGVSWLRYRAVLLGGALCGVSGAYLSIAENAGFVRDMSAGKGYLALAALIFGKWRPGPTLAACLLFALADALQVRLQGVALPGIGVIPVQFVEALPYALTVLLLAGFVGRAAPPGASGVPYRKGRQ